MTRDRPEAARWDALFRDLEGQLEAADRVALADEVADRTRRELARLSLADRLRRAESAPVTLALGGAGEVSGRVRHGGPDWVLMEDARAEVLVLVDAVLVATGLPPAAAEPEAAGAVEGRLRVGYPLRLVSRDRAAVRLLLRDGRALVGTIDRVGADFLDLAEHPEDEPRRPANVRAVRTVPFHALAAVRRV